MEFHDVLAYLNSLREKISLTLQESSSQDKFILASNVLTEVEPYIPRLTVEPKYSKVLQDLIELLASSPDQRENRDEKVDLLVRILNVLFINSDFTKTARDMFGSHVLQTSLNGLTALSRSSPKFDHLLQYIADKIEEQCLFEMMRHSSGSHFLRTVLLSLVNEVDNTEHSLKRVNFDAVQVRDKNITDWRRQRLLNWTRLVLKDFDSVLKNTQSCVSFCLMIHLLKMTNQLSDDIMMSILAHCTGGSRDYKNLSFILQSCIHKCDNAQYTYLFKNLICKELNALCYDPYANYVVQSFIEHQHFQESHLRHIIENVNLRTLTNSKTSAICWKLCKSCVDLFSCQDLFYKKVLTDFEVDDMGQFWHTVLSGGETNSSFSVTNNAPPTTTELILKPSACSMLSHVVKFQKTAITDLLSSFKQFMETVVSRGKFAQVVCNVNFSRVMENVFDVRLAHFSDKYVRKLLPIFEENALELALDNCGCHVLHSYFTLLKVSDKIRLLSLLTDHFEKIQMKNRKLVKLLNLSEFRINRKLYQKKLEKTESVRELFKDIIEK